MTQQITRCILALCLAALAPHASADVVVVVSAKNPVTTMSADEVSQIFLGKSNNFPGGAPAIAIDLAEGSPLREAFYVRVTGKSASQLKAYWSKLIFTGKGQPPKEVGSSTDVKKLLADNPNLIGYIEKNALDGTLKSVFAP